MGSLDNHCLSTLFPRPGEGLEGRLLGENTAGRGEETVGGHHSVRGQGCKLKNPGGPGGAPESPPEVEVQRMLSTGVGQRSR